jgi:hypothetical protein
VNDPLEHDPDLLSRWLSVMWLISSAEQMLVRGGGAWPALSLVSADAAVEALLGMIAATGTAPPKDKESFDGLHALALKALRHRKQKLPAGLGDRLVQHHHQRNAGLHLGAEIAPEVAERAIRAARELRQLVRQLSPVLGLVDDEGAIRAVGRLTGLPKLIAQMDGADAALKANDSVGALDHAAMALYLLTQRLDPRLDPIAFPPATGTYQEVDREPAELQRWVESWLEAHETWMMALALGMHPAEYRHLLGTVGIPVYYVVGADLRSEVRRAEVPEPAACEAAVLKVADVVFRLWQIDAIRHERRDANGSDHRSGEAAAVPATSAVK